MTFETSVANESNAMAAGPACLIQHRDRPASETADILFEQLAYLIHFANQEQGRLERVKAVLMEPFQ